MDTEFGSCVTRQLNRILKDRYSTKENETKRHRVIHTVNELTQNYAIQIIETLLKEHEIDELNQGIVTEALRLLQSVSWNFKLATISSSDTTGEID